MVVEPKLASVKTILLLWLDTFPDNDFGPRTRRYEMEDWCRGSTRLAFWPFVLLFLLLLLASQGELIRLVS
jgi:hypothetical protein